MTLKEMFAPAIAAATAKAEEQFAEAIHARPGLAAALDAAEQGWADANFRFHNFQVFLARATHHGLDDVTTAVREMEYAERALRDAAGARLTRAKHDLAQCDWVLECKRDEVAQLALLANPPNPDYRPAEVVKRPVAPAPEDFDLIEFPSGRQLPGKTAE